MQTWADRLDTLRAEDDLQSPQPARHQTNAIEG